MENVSWWIGEIALLGSGYTYGQSFARKQKSWIRRMAELSAYVMLLAGIHYFGRTDRIGMQALKQIVNFLFIMYMMYTEWELSVRGAVYYSIWSIMCWRILRQLWMLVEAVGMNVWTRNPMYGWIGECMVFFS